ncbi:MAG: SCO family protein [Gemmatimonadaceae bacterium]
MRARHRTLALLFALCAAASCTGNGAAERSGMTGFRGVSLSNPITKPSFVLTGTNGQPWDFARETEGKVALLFFGYTHCPDVCPLHMANIAAVLKKMPFEQRDLIRVVFVTTDPARDTPERLKEWLGAIDPTFGPTLGDHRFHRKDVVRAAGAQGSTRGRR